MMASDFLPEIDPNKCNGCALCVQACPNQVLVVRDGLAVVDKPTACNYSAKCQEICPTQAICLTYEIVCNDEAVPKK